MRASLFAVAVSAALLVGCQTTNKQVQSAPLDEQGKRNLATYFDIQILPKAFAFAPGKGHNWHAWGYDTAAETQAIAIAKCSELGAPCVLYAVDNQVVWKP